MALEAFDAGRKYEGLVRQLNSIFDEIDRAKDRDQARSIYLYVVQDIYPTIESLARNYGVDRHEKAHNAHIYSCCVDEKFYQTYKAQQEQFRKDLYERG